MLDQYAQYMSSRYDDPYSAQMRQPVLPPAAPAAAAPAAGGGMTAALPYVGAGLQAAGLLSSLYGGYKAQKMAERNYRDQKREFERQRRMQEDEVRRSKERELMQNQYTAKGAIDNDEDRLLSKYAGYFRGIGL